MYTANTMAAAAEAIGMSLPGAAARPRSTTAARCPRARAAIAVTKVLEWTSARATIMTREAFQNAIAVVMALAGSTNAVLHLLAIAHEAQVELALDDFDRISRAMPHLVDVRPAGKFVMSDLDRVGGVPVVMKELLDAGLLHGDCVTVTGKTIAENLADVAPPRPTARWSRASERPDPPEGGTAILCGSLAPDGSVMKIAGAGAGRVPRPRAPVRLRDRTRSRRSRPDDRRRAT